MAPVNTRKKRVSKKNKKSWRKNTDTRDVDTFLEELRQEEREGGPISAKRDEQLFTIDRTASKRANLDESSRLLTKKERRKNSKPLRCFTAMQNESCIPAKIARPPLRQPSGGKIHAAARQKRENNKFLRKIAISREDRMKEREKRTAIQEDKKTLVSMDLWGNENVTVNHGLPGDASWLQAQTLVHTIQTLAKKIGKKPKMAFKKNSVLPAVEAPHPGESYNPSYADHQDLLRKVVEHEYELIKEEKHIERVTAPMYGKRSERPTPESILAEMSEGLPSATATTEVPAAGEEDEDSDYKAFNAPVQNRKKTLQKRRRIKETRDEKLKKEAEKVEKKKLSDIYRLRKLEEEMANEAKEQARLRALREKMEEYKALEPKQMSHHKYVAPELDFNMPQDLKGNIRNLKQEGDLLSDRFKSLQKRNIIETRVKQKMKRKYKPKKITKPSHKINDI